VYRGHGNGCWSYSRHRCSTGRRINAEADEATKRDSEFGTERRVEDEVDSAVDGDEKIEDVASYCQQMSRLHRNIVTPKFI